MRKCVAQHFENTRIIPRDAPVGHRRGNNPVEYVFIPRDVPVGHHPPVGHRRGNNPVEHVFIFIFLPRSRKKQCLILIEV